MNAPGLMMRTDGAVRILVNSNPAAKNAIIPALYDALPAALEQAAQDPAIGAIVLVDVARLDESFSPLDYFESKGIPFIVAVNEFDGVPRYPTEEIAAALALPPEVPIISLDARDREQAKGALVKITEYALTRLRESLTANAN